MDPTISRGVSKVCRRLIEAPRKKHDEYNEEECEIHAPHEPMTLMDIQALMDAVRRTSIPICSINLANCRMGNAGARHLARGLKDYTTLKSLGVCWNHLTDDAMEDMIVSFRSCHSLQNLDLDNNELGDLSALLIAKTWLTDTANCALQMLALNHNSITDEGTVALGRALASNSSLRNLCLAYNRVGNAGLVGLGQGLRANTTLQQLWIQGNPEITRKVGIQGFCQGLATNPSLTVFLSDLYDVRIKFYLHRNKLGFYKIMVGAHGVSLLPIVLSKTLAKYDGLDLCFDLTRNNPNLFVGAK